MIWFWVPALNFNERRDPDNITTIVVHATANSTLIGVISWFQNPTDPAKEYAGVDEQLNKAIEVILEELKTKEKKLPPIPPYKKKDK